jgi:hypothetical protein
MQIVGASWLAASGKDRLSLDPAVLSLDPARDPESERCSCRKRACSRWQRRNRLPLDTLGALSLANGQAGFLHRSPYDSCRYEDDGDSPAWVRLRHLSNGQAGLGKHIDCVAARWSGRDRGVHHAEAASRLAGPAKSHARWGAARGKTDSTDPPWVADGGSRLPSRGPSHHGDQAE